MRINDFLVEKKQVVSERPMGFIKQGLNKLGAKFLPGSFGAKAQGRLNTGTVANKLYKDFATYIGQTGYDSNSDAVKAFLKSQGTDKEIDVDSIAGAPGTTLDRNGLNKVFMSVAQGLARSGGGGDPPPAGGGNNPPANNNPPAPPANNNPPAPPANNNPPAGGGNNPPANNNPPAPPANNNPPAPPANNNPAAPPAPPNQRKTRTRNNPTAPPGTNPTADPGVAVAQGANTEPAGVTATQQPGQAPGQTQQPAPTVAQGATQDTTAPQPGAPTQPQQAAPNTNFRKGKVEKPARNTAATGLKTKPTRDRTAYNQKRRDQRAAKNATAQVAPMSTGGQAKANFGAQPNLGAPLPNYQREHTEEILRKIAIASVTGIPVTRDLYNAASRLMSENNTTLKYIGIKVDLKESTRHTVKLIKI
jgi:hypothetical protein